MDIHNLTIKFLAEGTWNRSFSTSDSDNGREYVFRVSLPLYPWYKTQAEVGTIQYIRRHTKIPVPVVYAFDSPANNDLGYDWILMRKEAGVPYRTIAHLLNIEKQKHIAPTIADWVHELSQLQFHEVCSLYLNPLQDNVSPGHPVIQQFMGGWRHEYHHERGPFSNIHSYTRSFVDCAGAEIYDPRQRLRANIDAFGDCIDGNADVAERQALRGRYDNLLSLSVVRANSSVEFETFRYRLADPDGRYHNDFASKAFNLARLTKLVDAVLPRLQENSKPVLYH